MIPNAHDLTTPPPPTARNDRLAALFLFGLVAFCPLLVRVFGTSTAVFGWPLLIVYTFVVWGGIILLVALDVERRPITRPRRDKGAVSDRSGPDTARTR